MPIELATIGHLSADGPHRRFRRLDPGDVEKRRGIPTEVPHWFIRRLLVELRFHDDRWVWRQSPQINPHTNLLCSLDTGWDNHVIYVHC